MIKLLNQVALMTTMTVVSATTASANVCSSYNQMLHAELPPAQTLGWVFLTVALPQATVITAVICAVSNAEVDESLLKKEATLVLEEDKVYVPSFLGTYAQEHGYTDIRTAAEDVVIYGVAK